MKALVLNGDWDISVQDRPSPTAGPGQVTVRVIATGICGSDFHGYTGENGRRHPGQVMGHETVGRVHEFGEGVGGLTTNQLVTINPVIGCGHCDRCAQGIEQWCPSKVVLGVAPELSAAFADLVVVPARNIVTLPDDLPEELGALVEPLAVGYHAAVRGRCGPDDRVLVIGGGPIGQACVLAALRLGASAVAVSDLNRSRRELCASLGAATVVPEDGDLAAQVAAALGGEATLVLDAVGLSASVRDAVACSGLGATVVLVGMGSPELEVQAYAVSTQERSLVGSFCYSATEFADTAAWVGTQPQGLDRLIDGRVGWDQASESFDALARGTSSASKILVFPQGLVDGSSQ